MSTDPEILPSYAEPLPGSQPVPEAAPPEPVQDSRTKRPRHVPNFGDLALFLVLVGASLLITQLFAIGLAKVLHFFPRDTIEDLAQEPLLILPTMLLSYLVALLASIAAFGAVWKMPFAEGVRWDLGPLARRAWLPMAIGVGLSIAVQVLSNFLPIPKELPIDKYFKTPLDVWIIAFFGVFVAPPCEELAFRGFLLPGLANTWDYLAARYRNRRQSRLEATHFEVNGAALPLSGEAAEAPALAEIPSPLSAFTPHGDPVWSPAALVFAATLSSLAFALLHADQLAHAYSPLAVLFCVSLVLCFIRLRWRSLAASALVHASYNATIFALLFIGTGGFRHLEKLSQ